MSNSLYKLLNNLNLNDKKKEDNIDKMIVSLNRLKIGKNVLPKNTIINKIVMNDDLIGFLNKNPSSIVIRSPKKLQPSPLRFTIVNNFTPRLALTYYDKSDESDLEKDIEMIE
jgi:hypothetical protein